MSGLEGLPRPLFIYGIGGVMIAGGLVALFTGVSSTIGKVALLVAMVAAVIIGAFNFVLCVLAVGNVLNRHSSRDSS